MEVHERILLAVTSGPPPEPGWFAARQPGIIRYLELRYGGASEAFGVALHAASLLHAAYEKTTGAAPRRIPSQVLERAEEIVMAECEAPVPPGFVARQPALATFVAGVVAAPPVPLDDTEQTLLGRTLAAIIVALDDFVALD
jgi:hypothetical protein